MKKRIDESERCDGDLVGVRETEQYVTGIAVGPEVMAWPLTVTAALVIQGPCE